jgi:tetratricopeptide (TPR) repeat protein
MPRLMLLAMLAITAGSMPALADDRDCFQQKDSELRIKGCSEIIGRDPNDAAAYHNRGEAYALAGNLERAIADYTKTIEIKPDTAAAYDSRGRAYAAKGDYTRAVADVTKATELAAVMVVRAAATAPKQTQAQPPKAAAAMPPKTTKAAVVTTAVRPNVVAKDTSDYWPTWARFKNEAGN